MITRQKVGLAISKSAVTKVYSVDLQKRVITAGEEIMKDFAALLGTPGKAGECTSLSSVIANLTDVVAASDVEEGLVTSSFPNGTGKLVVEHLTKVKRVVDMKLSGV